MKHAEKYGIQYFAPQNPPMRWAKRDHIEKAPIWASVDLRDGNQALVTPMSLPQKLDFFAMLVKVGFKEIEVGFPAASDTEYQFVRALIENQLIPEDVTVQVLSPAREHIIEKTFESIKGAKNVIFHLYNPISKAQREQVFKASKDEIREMAVSAAKLCNALRKQYNMEETVRFAYGEESFTGTEPEYAAQVANEVIAALEPERKKPVILNLPVTVSLSMPHVYANQVEYICDHLEHRENVIVSLHPHNDRGCAIADTEMGLLAGGQRVEGTLFGNGERTGNVDILTLALNLYAQGIEPNLDFTDVPALRHEYEALTGMEVPPRAPYAGELVFAAFSGGHQDAITKGMRFRDDNGLFRWTVPYLPIDPSDIGREYQEDVIRINSQSGKGGISYVLENHYGFDLPMQMREDFGYTVKRVSDVQHRELTAEDVLSIFMENYVNNFDPLDVVEAHFKQENGIIATITVYDGTGVEKVFSASGNGRLDAVSNALKQHLGYRYSIVKYQEHAIEQGSASKAIAYIGIRLPDGSVTWGAGTHDDVMAASVNALVSAINRSRKSEQA